MEDGELMPEQQTDKAVAEPLEGPTSIAVFGLSWLGLKADNLGLMCDFFERIFRLHPVHRCDRDHAIYRTDNGDYVVLYGPKSTRYELFETGPIVGFRVGNLTAARAEMEARGIIFLGETKVKDNGRWKYAHFRGPDGAIYELVEETLFSRVPVSLTEAKR